MTSSTVGGRSMGTAAPGRSIRAARSDAVERSDAERVDAAARRERPPRARVTLPGSPHEVSQVGRIGASL
jgi:hypothetical protein